MSQTLKWNWGGWFLGNAAGFFLFGKLSYQAGRGDDFVGAALMAGFVLMQGFTVFYPWFRRPAVPPGRAAMVHICAVFVASMIAVAYFRHSDVLDPSTRTEISRAPWVIGVILVLVFGLIVYATIKDRRLANTRTDAITDSEPTVISPPLEANVSNAERASTEIHG